MILAHQKLIWLIAIVSVFIAFAKLKSGYFLYRSKAIKMMTYGCILLFFGTMVGLAGHIGLLGSGYSNSMVYFTVESVFGYIGGWALIIWGMTLWLPYLFSVSNRLQKKTKSVTLYESITKVSSYGDASPSTFSRIAADVIENYGYQGASFHIQNQSNTLSLFSSVGLTEKSKEVIANVNEGLYEKVYKTGEIFQADETIRIHKDLIVETTSGPVVDALAMPVDFGIKRVGVLTIYTDHPRIFSQEELRVLEAVCANLGLAFYRDGLQKSIKSHQGLKDLIAVMLKTSRTSENLNTTVVRLAKLLKQYMKFTSLDLFLVGDGSPHMLDFALPAGGKVIIQKGHFNDSNYVPVRWVLKNNRGLTLPDNTDLLDENYKMSNSLRSNYTPIVISGKSVGVLRVSVKSNWVFNHNDLIALETISTVIAGSVLEEINNSITSEAFEQIGSIKYSLESVDTHDMTENIYRELAKIIVENTPATFCRIMLLDRDNKRFNTAAIYQRRKLRWDESAIVGLPIDELYAHRKVMATGKPEIINDEDSTIKISAFEARMLMPENISQCMILPITSDGRTIGVITIGESRKSDRNKFTSHKLIFAALLSNVISMIIWKKENITTRNILVNSNRAANQRLRNFENQAESINMISGFNTRINGPLAGIIASCEYLKDKNDLNREDLDRYIDLIGKNAGKIHKLTSKFAEARRAIETVIRE